MSDMVAKCRAQHAKDHRASATISAGEASLLKLVRKGMDKHGGWATVSPIVWPAIASLPDELVERRQYEDGGGKCSLTVRGALLLEYLQ